MDQLAYLDLAQLDGSVRREGTVTFTMAGVPLTLELRHRHERGYAAKLLLAVRYPQADIDSLLFENLLRPGDRVLDGGANIGFTALESLQAGASLVVALEPEPGLFARLRELHHPRLIALDLALSSSEGQASMLVSVAHNQGSSLKPEMLDVFPQVFGDAPPSVLVTLTTIDRLATIYGPFDIWKLDVEGAEPDALRGASASLACAPPRLIIVELYERFFDEFFDAAWPTHPHVARACIAKDGYRLTLLPPNAAIGEGFYTTSPMYVFSTEPLALRSTVGSP